MDVDIMEFRVYSPKPRMIILGKRHKKAVTTFNWVHYIALSVICYFMPL